MASNDDTQLIGERAYAASLPGKRVTILACMDPRIEVGRIIEAIREIDSDVNSSNAFILRNAGGRAQEALRSIIVSQNFLRTTDVHIVHHTKCGMSGHSEGSMRAGLYGLYPEGYAPHLINQHQYLPIRTDDVNESVREDLALVRNYPLVHPKTNVMGWEYVLTRVSEGVYEGKVLPIAENLPALPRQG
ncbi:carbonic anhydrase [Ceratobasidium sp. AG-I]|nr:carbonic anhydrase [Ceratobasidium sp. AG-I]